MVAKGRKNSDTSIRKYVKKKVNSLLEPYFAISMLLFMTECIYAIVKKVFYDRSVNEK